MKARIKINKNWSNQPESALDKGVLEMTTDIHKRAGIIAPKETRALLNSGRIERVRQFTYRVRFGSSRVPYALIRHFVNFKNPQTLRYLERAGDSVSRGSTAKYFRNKGL